MQRLQQKEKTRCPCQSADAAAAAAPTTAPASAAAAAVIGPAAVAATGQGPAEAEAIAAPVHVEVGRMQGEHGLLPEEGPQHSACHIRRVSPERLLKHQQVRVEGVCKLIMSVHLVQIAPRGVLSVYA